MASWIKTKLSQFWLITVSILFLFLSLLFYSSGLVLIKSSSSKTPQMLQHVNTSSAGWTLLFIGTFFLVLSLSGCFTSVRVSAASFAIYIASISLTTLAVLVGGVIFLQQLGSRGSNYRSLTTEDWKKLQDVDKDFIQQTFGCCGFDAGDNLAYKGPSVDFWSSSNSTVSNLCTGEGASKTGCHDAMISSNTGAERFVLIFLIISLIICIFSISAAVVAKSGKSVPRKSDNWKSATPLL